MAQLKYKRVLLKISGEALAGDKHFGFDFDVVSKVCDVINLFITAPLENRIKRVAARNGISENEAKDRIKKTDKSRASYYNYYSAKDWGDAKSYDLCIDSSLLGIDGTVELLKDLIRIKGIK